MALILGIESSCDDTAVALYHGEKGLIHHLLSSSTSDHARYGGIVPELASRDHILKMGKITQLLLNETATNPRNITGIAFTQGPGLAGSLMVGTMFAKSLSMGWSIPAIGIHHIEGHLQAIMLEAHRPQYPFISLIVSGGHTLLVKAKAFGQYEILGQTLDDAAGEAFDKVGKQLGLGYPGGPEVAQLATKGQAQVFMFSRPLINKPGLDFSFSGLKTQVNQTIAQLPKPLSDQTKADIAHAFEEAAVDTLVTKCLRAIKLTGIKRITVAGGVGANKKLREKLSQACQLIQCDVFLPSPKYCTDNAAMIAYCGYERLTRDETSELSATVKTRWPLDTLS